MSTTSPWGQTAGSAPGGVFVPAAPQPDLAPSRPVYDGTLGELYAIYLRHLVLMIVTLSQSFLFAFGGFLVMLISALWFERNARKLGRAGLEQMTRSDRSAGIKDYFGTTSQRMRERFRRED